MEKVDTAILAGGCFWCTEAVFKRLKGVLTVVPGYTGGTVVNPTYEQVTLGTTGHAEAIQITFDPHIISYPKLLEIFFHLHDPTTLNRQGHDTGTQYRSAIFYLSANQKQSAEAIKTQIESEKIYPGQIVTEIVPATTFYVAENYHQNYYQKNSYQSYCQLVIDPKVRKLLQKFSSDVKKEFTQL